MVQFGSKYYPYHMVIEKSNNHSLIHDLWTYFEIPYKSSYLCYHVLIHTQTRLILLPCPTPNIPSTQIGLNNPSNSLIPSLPGAPQNGL